MSAHGNNATPPSPAIAPGVERIDPAQVAVEIARRGVDERIRRVMPGFDAPFFQAGLAGYSDAAMRIVARRHGAPFCVTEALLDRMLLGGGRGFDKADLQLICEALPAGKEDQPLVGQIIGSDPDEMAAAALKMIEQGSRNDRAYRDMAYGEGELPKYVDTKWEVCGEEVGGSYEGIERPKTNPPLPLPQGGINATTFASIDVNLACPVKKIDRKHRGGHWLTEPQGAIDILRAVRQATPADVPCSVKLRRAYDDTPEMARNFEVIFNACYELGYAWTTVHARTVEQRYIGPSRWEFLRDLVSRHPDKPVFGSGDVWEVQDIFRMIAYAGVSGVSVARGCIGNPWIFTQARRMMAGLEPGTPSLDEQRSVLMQHFELAVQLNGEKHASRLMRKFGIRFAAHHPQCEQVRQAMIAVSNLGDWHAMMERFYPVTQRA